MFWLLIKHSRENAWTWLGKKRPDINCVRRCGLMKKRRELPNLTTCSSHFFFFFFSNGKSESIAVKWDAIAERDTIVERAKKDREKKNAMKGKRFV